MPLRQKSVISFGIYFGISLALLKWCQTNGHWKLCDNQNHWCNRLSNLKIKVKNKE